MRFFSKKKNQRDSKPVQVPVEIDFDIEKIEKEMSATVKLFEGNLHKISVGRGDPRVFDEVYVPAKHATLSEISQIIPKNANEITVKPFDPKDVEAALAALNSSEIRMNCRKDASGVIHINIPKPTQEFRIELIKQARQLSEETKQNIRKKRQHSLNSLKEFKDVGEDEIKKLKNDVQKITDKFTENVENILKEKEKSINS